MLGKPVQEYLRLMHKVTLGQLNSESSITRDEETTLAGIKQRIKDLALKSRRNLILTATKLIPQPSKKRRICVCLSTMSFNHWTQCNQALERITDKIRPTNKVSIAQLQRATTHTRELLEAQGSWSSLQKRKIDLYDYIMTKASEIIYTNNFPVR